MSVTVTFHIDLSRLGSRSLSDCPELYTVSAQEVDLGRVEVRMVHGLTFLMGGTYLKVSSQSNTFETESTLSVLFISITQSPFTCANGREAHT